MRRKIGQCVANGGYANRVGPRERSARIVDALLHREVDRLRRGDTLHDGVGGLVGQHRDDAQHRKPGNVVETGYGEAGRLQRADGRDKGGVAAGIRAGDREPGSCRIVECQVVEHEIAHAVATTRAVAVRPSVAASHTPPALPAIWIAPPGKRESARARSTATPAAAIRSANRAAPARSPCTVRREGAGWGTSVRGSGRVAPSP